MQLLADIAKQLGSFVMYWVKQFRQQDISLDPVFLLLIAVLITLWLGSACWASSIAESRGYGARLHFLIGLLLPIVYPPVLLLGMDVKKKRPAKKKEAEAEVKSVALPSAGEAPAPRQAPPPEEQPAKKKRKKDNTKEEEEPLDTSALIIPEDEEAPPASQTGRGGPALHPLRKRKTQAAEQKAAASGKASPEFDQTYFREMADKLENDPERQLRIRYAGGREVTAHEIDEATAQYAVVRIVTDEGSTQRTRIPYARIETVEPVEKDANN